MSDRTPDEPTPPRLDLDVELLPEQTRDDLDEGGAAPADPAALLRRYRDETPPHHGD